MIESVKRVDVGRLGGGDDSGQSADSFDQFRLVSFKVKGIPRVTSLLGMLTVAAAGLFPASTLQIRKESFGSYRQAAGLTPQ